MTKEDSHISEDRAETVLKNVRIFMKGVKEKVREMMFQMS